jgi:NAD(P)-dependent dehydrogenase (short-subunit alcohol dehydrogenase family)
MTELEGCVTVLTGAAGGLGRALCRQLLDRGGSVVAADVDAGGVRQLCAQVDASGGRTLAVPADITDPGAVDALAGLTLERFGRVDMLINNAAVQDRRPFWEYALSDWERLLRVNLCGALLTTRAFLPLLSRSAGRLVNVASLASVIAPAGIAPYCVSKHALLGLSDALRADLEAAGSAVTVTTVLPSQFASNLGAGTEDDGGPVADGPASWAIDVEVVAARALRGIEARQPYVFTHPQRMHAVVERFEAMLASISADESCGT